jgi:hypothetical protein
MTSQPILASNAPTSTRSFNLGLRGGQNRTWTRLGATLFGAAALLATSLISQAHAATITMDNWRSIYMNGHYALGGSNENVFMYALHTTRQENLLAHFDVSSYAGQTAVGDAAMTFTVSGHNNVTNTIEVRQLNAFNSIVDLDNSGSYFRDTANSSGGLAQWRDNAGNALSHLNYNNSVLDITSSLLDTAVGPAVVGDQVSFTIGQSDFQQWLDGNLASTVALTMENSPWSHYEFLPDATLTFNTSGGASVSAPATLGLFAAALFVPLFSRRRLTAH